MKIKSIHQIDNAVIFYIEDISDIADVEQWTSRDVPDSLRGMVEIKNRTIYITHPLVTMGFVTRFGTNATHDFKAPYLLFEVNLKTKFAADLSADQLVYAHYGQSM